MGDEVLEREASDAVVGSVSRVGHCYGVWCRMKYLDCGVIFRFISFFPGAI